MEANVLFTTAYNMCFMLLFVCEQAFFFACFYHHHHLFMVSALVHAFERELMSINAI